MQRKQESHVAQFAEIDGIRTQYEVVGKGIPLLMLAPAGFDASMSRWRLTGAWKAVQPLDTLAGEFQMITYDRREAGESGGRIEPLTWENYARHAKALLDHLGIESAVVLGGCMGCSVAVAFADLFPEACAGLLLHWPVGGYRWYKNTHGKFASHIAYARVRGLQGVAEKAAQSKVFWGDAEAGPWSAVIASDADFRAHFVAQDLEAYLRIVTASADLLFPDTMPSGLPGAQLLEIETPTFIMPGDDASHSLSCAHALRELIPGAQFSSLNLPQQDSAAIRQWVRDSGRAAWGKG
jgi:pimeloyl-ACP methyl ester carboxylesterase